MAVVLQAPASLIKTVTVLPSPSVGDSYAPRDEIVVNISMNGTKRTYVKRPGTYKLLFSFRIDFMKAFELFAFIEEYCATEMQLIDHHDRLWRGFLMTNPNELRKIPEQKIRDNCENEMCTISLEFQMRRL